MSEPNHQVLKKDEIDKVDYRVGKLLADYYDILNSTEAPTPGIRGTYEMLDTLSMRMSMWNNELKDIVETYKRLSIKYSDA